MVNVAILGFGVVGSGVCELLTNNAREVAALGGDEVNIKYILDRYDFPSSPFASKIIHDFDIIANDPQVDCVIEAMGGSHPAYEFTMAALNAGKSVITSNKEVVSRFGDEFLAAAEKNGVCYRFEAAVGGGIPVISPVIGCVRQNKITEIRGILNGTTNYILTKMFSFGASFEESLRDAQQRGYAESNPDADILGTDACRKIAILSSLVTGRLTSTDKIHTEGITAIRAEDVAAAEKVGMKIKLLGRCIIDGEQAQIMVAPFMLGGDLALSHVDGVYNAIEVLGEPIGSVMFYGPGAGGGATASAMVGDLVQIMRSGRATAQPTMIKTDEGFADFAAFKSRNYIALSGVDASAATAVFGNAQVISEGDELALITPEISEAQVTEAIAALTARGATLKSRIRLV